MERCAHEVSRLLKETVLRGELWAVEGTRERLLPNRRAGRADGEPSRLPDRILIVPDGEEVAMDLRHRRSRAAGLVAVLAAASVSCTGAMPPTGGRSTPRASPTTDASSHTKRSSPVDSRVPLLLGEPIDVSTLAGRIVLSTEEDVYAANADGTGLVRLTRRPGPEFDPAWSPDGSRIVYRSPSS